MITAGRVLVVEDDVAVRGVLVRGLAEHGFQVTAVGTGAAAMSHFAGGGDTADVVVLDIGLPDADGRDVCQALRTRGVGTPVLFLTARGQTGDLVSGFAAGGDEYVAKPFDLAELVARLQGLLRRSVAATPEPVHGLLLDPAAHALSCEGERVRLSPTEFRLLAALLHPAGRVVRRRELVAAGWPDGALVHDNTLDQYAAKLRRKLAGVGSTRTIRTVHGVGYELT